jgi:hypothetical protein
MMLTRSQARRLRTLINLAERFAIDHAFRKQADPSDVPNIERNYREAQAWLRYFISTHTRGNKRHGHCSDS